MCSIYGTIGENFKRMQAFFSKELYHRGPDDKGVFYDESHQLALGHNRLSIIDLSDNAHQPMTDENQNYILVFNGEVYNYKELKNKLIKLGFEFFSDSDTEVVLKSYIAWGVNCVEYFRGMFAFCIYNKEKEELFLTRDRFGIKPLIYSFLDNQFIFTSELKPILNSNFIPKKLDHNSVSDYFRYGSVKQPKTILKGIYFLMPGHWMKVKFDLNYEIKQYYDLSKEALNLPKIETYQEAIQAVRSELETATKYHMVSDVEVGAFLSGGIDSTAVVAMMKNLSDKQINTYSIGFKQKTEVTDETDVAESTAKFLGTMHHDIKIDDNYIVDIFDDFIESLDQPSIDGINTYIVSRETAKDMKVAISGLGGDEIFAGYQHFKTISEYSQKNIGLVSFLGRKLNSIRPNRFTNKYELMGLEEELGIDKQRTINNNLKNILKNNSTFNLQPSKFENLSSIQKISKKEIDNYMLNTLLRDNDVLSMAHSLELRPILLDHKLAELAFSVDDSFKIKDGVLKSVFVDSVKDMIPKEVWQRSKKGFEMPFASWMNGELNERFKAIIDSKKAKQIFVPKYLNNLRKRVESKTLKRKDWMSFVFLNWIEKYNILI